MGPGGPAQPERCSSGSQKYCSNKTWTDRHKLKRSRALFQPEASVLNAALGCSLQAASRAGFGQQERKEKRKKRAKKSQGPWSAASHSGSARQHLGPFSARSPPGLPLPAPLRGASSQARRASRANPLFVPEPSLWPPPLFPRPPSFSSEQSGSSRPPARPGPLALRDPRRRRATCAPRSRCGDWATLPEPAAPRRFQGPSLRRKPGGGAPGNRSERARGSGARAS